MTFLPLPSITNHCVESPDGYLSSLYPTMETINLWSQYQGAASQLLTPHQGLSSPPTVTSQAHQPTEQTANKLPLKRKRRMTPGEDSALCCACGVKAGPHIYYGARACIPCRAFFRRSVEEKLYNSYVCFKTNKSCDISKQGRKACKYCRYQVCHVMNYEQQSL